MKKYAVGAYKDGAFSYWASISYDSRTVAEDFCTACNEKCSQATGMTYIVKEI